MHYNSEHYGDDRRAHLWPCSRQHVLNTNSYWGSGVKQGWNEQAKHHYRISYVGRPWAMAGLSRKLKQLVADLGLDKYILQDVLSKKL